MFKSHFQRICSVSKKLKNNDFFVFSDILKCFQNGATFAFSEFLKNLKKAQKRLLFMFSDILKNFKKAKKILFFVFSDILKYFRKLKNNKFFMFSDILIQISKNDVSFEFSEIFKTLKSSKGLDFLCSQIFFKMFSKPPKQHFFRVFRDFEKLYKAQKDCFFMFSDILKCFQTVRSFAFSGIFKNFK